MVSLNKLCSAKLQIVLAALQLKFKATGRTTTEVGIVHVWVSSTITYLICCVIDL